MTDNDVIKALECCSNDDIGCEECPANGLCDNDAYCFTGAILDLIKRLQAENERISKLLKLEAEGANTLNDVIAERDAEIERLEALSERLGNDVDLKLKYIYELEEKAKTAKSEARKEFAERVKTEFYYEFDEIIPSVMADKIDNLLEEMEKENNDEC